MMKLSLILIFSFLLSFHLGAQNKYRLMVMNTDSSKESGKLISQIEYQHLFTDTIQRRKEIQKLLLKIYTLGYLEATFDYYQQDSSVLKAYLSPGVSYEWVHFTRGNLPEDIGRILAFKEKQFENSVVSHKKIESLFEKIIRYYENNGYPFVSVNLDSIIIKSPSEQSQSSRKGLWFIKSSRKGGGKANGIYAKLKIDLHNYCKIDSLEIKGDSKIGKAYLYNYLKIKPGDVYNEELIQNISNRIKEIPFVQEIRPFKIIFEQTQTKVILYLKRKNANQFDGVIGLVPSTNASKSVQFTGDVKLRLQNVINRGELIDLNWRSPKALTQDLKINVVYPFIVNSPFGIDYKLNIYKLDTTYLSVNNIIAIQYLLGNGSFLQAFWDNLSSNIISQKIISNATVLPPYADITSSIYGIGFKIERLNYRLNPEKGYYLNLTFGAGTKTIQRNAAANPDLYKNLQMTSNQYKVKFIFDWFIPIYNKNVLFLENQTSYINSTNLFENELFKVGGLTTLRGFDDQSIAASFITIYNIEYRYLFEQNSNIHLFYNAAYYEKNLINQFVHDKPYGFGVGMSFETKAGIFSLNYAMGSQFGNAFDIKSAKIHFGIVNTF